MATSKSRSASKAGKTKPKSSAKSKPKAKPASKPKPGKSKKPTLKKASSAKPVKVKKPAAKPAKATPRIKSKENIKPKSVTKQSSDPKPASTKPSSPKTTQPSNLGKIRYNDKELAEFKQIILGKLEDSKVELSNLTSMLNHSGDHGTDDTASTFKVLEDGSESFAKEEAAQLAARQKKFIEQLEAALIRIQNKTYGVCRVTGKLIPKERLRAVPHTTQSMEAKLKQYN